MQPKQRTEFVLVIQALAATFSREATEALLTGYWIGLQDLDLAGVKRAAAAAMHHSRFMPTVAELRELSGEMPAATRAALAWQAVREAVCRHGYYDSVRFDDPLIVAVIRNGWQNWIVFDDTLEAGKEEWIRKEFERLYVALWNSGKRFDPADYLMGASERSRQQEGARWLGTSRDPGPREIVLIETGLPAIPARLAVEAKQSKALPAPSALLAGIGAMPEGF
jgi:ribosomal protein L31E